MKNLFGVLFLVLSCVAQAQLPSGGLSAYYPFNNSAADESGNKNDGQMFGAIAPAADRFGNPCGAFRFIGSGSYISAPGSASLKSPSSSLTITAWVKPERSAGGNNDLNLILLSKPGIEAGGNAQYCFQIKRIFGDSYSNISLAGDFSFQDKQYNAHPIDFNQWYFIAVTYDENFVQVYQDGKLICQAPKNKPFQSNDLPLEIGRDIAAGKKYFNGCLDDLRIYNRGLSFGELNALFKDSTGKTGGEKVVLNMPKNIKRNTEKGDCYATVMYTEPTATIGCGEVVLKQVSGGSNSSHFDVGVNILRYEATVGNHKLADSLVITVSDDEAPVFNCPADINAQARFNAPGVEVAYPDLSVSDNCPGVKSEMREGLKTGAVFPVGVTILKYSATDASGNKSDCSFKVTVTREEPPAQDPVKVAEEKPKIPEPVAEKPVTAEAVKVIPKVEEPGKPMNGSPTAEQLKEKAKEQLKQVREKSAESKETVKTKTEEPVKETVKKEEVKEVEEKPKIPEPVAQKPVVAAGTKVIPRTEEPVKPRTDLTNAEQAKEKAREQLQQVREKPAEKVTEPAKSEESVEQLLLKFEEAKRRSKLQVPPGETPAKPEPVVEAPKAEPVKTNPVKTEEIKPKTETPVAVKTEMPKKVEPVVEAPKPEPVKPTPVKMEEIKAKTEAPVAVKTEKVEKPVNAEPVAEAPKAEPVKPNPVKAEEIKPKTEAPVVTKPAKTEPAVEKPKVAEPAKGKPVKNLFITCASDLSPKIESGTCGATVNYAAPRVPLGNAIVVVQTRGLQSGAVFPLGTTTNTFLVTDGAGFERECSFNVTVRDNIAPVFTCPKDTVILLPRGRRGLIYHYKPPYARDNCGIDSILLAAGSKDGCFLDIGVHPFIFKAYDKSGNVETCTYSVMVREDPTLVDVKREAPVKLDPKLVLGGDSVHYEHKASVTNCELTLLIYDDGEQDNDSVSIIFNDEVIVNRDMIRVKENGPFKRNVSLIPGEQNFVIAKAWNTGKYGLNTLRIDVYDVEDDKRDSKFKKPLLSKILHSKPGDAGGLLLKCN